MQNIKKYYAVISGTQKEIARMYVVQNGTHRQVYPGTAQLVTQFMGGTDVSKAGDGSVIATMNGDVITITGPGIVDANDVAVLVKDYEAVTVIFENNVQIPDAYPYLNFGRCTTLETVKLPAGCTTIAYQLFYGCTALKKVWIPKPVTEITVNDWQGIQRGPFYNAAQTTHIYCEASAKPASWPEGWNSTGVWTGDGDPDELLPVTWGVAETTFLAML